MSYFVLTNDLLLFHDGTTKPGVHIKGVKKVFTLTNVFALQLFGMYISEN